MLILLVLFCVTKQTWLCPELRHLVYLERIPFAQCADLNVVAVFIYVEMYVMIVEPVATVKFIKIFCVSVRASDKRIACDEEFSDSEDEGEGGRRNVADHKKGAKKARIEEDKKETEDKKTGQFTVW